MYDLIDLVSYAVAQVTTPVDISAIDVRWDGEDGIPFEEASSFPMVIAFCERPSVEFMNSCGSMRVNHAVHITIRFVSQHERGTSDAEKELKDYEKVCRAIVYNIGKAHSEGLTEIELDETDMQQKSSNGGRSGVSSASITFNIAFDEGDY